MLYDDAELNDLTAFDLALPYYYYILSMLNYFAESY